MGRCVQSGEIAWNCNSAQAGKHLSVFLIVDVCEKALVEVTERLVVLRMHLVKAKKSLRISDAECTTNFCYKQQICFARCTTKIQITARLIYRWLKFKIIKGIFLKIL